MKFSWHQWPHGNGNSGTLAQYNDLSHQPCKKGTETSPPPTLRTFSFKSIIHCTNVPK